MQECGGTGSKICMLGLLEMSRINSNLGFTRLGVFLATAD